MRVVIAPDSFKGSLDAVRVAAALARGWRSVRADDEIVMTPMADGGEGTAAIVASVVDGSRWIESGPVTGPDGRAVDGRWLALPDGVAVVELAISSGLPLMARPDPLAATTRGLGETLRAAVESGARRLVVALGGSASTDGGAGALRALGMRVRDDAGANVPEGGIGLLSATSVDASEMTLPPEGGVDILVDVDNPLCGPRGAAAVFGPQKGADAAHIELLDRALANWARLLGGDPLAAGGGAAGGAAYGLAAGWRGRLAPGARYVADLVGLDAALAGADLVITGEGAFDPTSLGGKACGEVLRRRASTPARAAIVAGAVTMAPAGVDSVSLTELAGDRAAAIRDADHWLGEAGAVLARREQSSTR